MQRTPHTLLACSDVHGSYDVVPGFLSKEGAIDGIILAGDLTTHGSVEEARRALRSWIAVLPVALVAGNMDPRQLESVFAQEAHYVNGRAIRWGAVAIFGVSGSPPTPMKTPYEISETEIMEHAERGWADAQDAPMKIFVPHAPPMGSTLDLLGGGRHAGSTAVRAFIERRQPDLVLCGHIHEARGREQIGRTTVVNCGPAHRGCYAVVHLEPELRVELRP